MGRTRNILDLAMAGGVVAAFVALTLPQSQQQQSTFQAVPSAQAISAQTISPPEAYEPLEIAHFLGIAQFVKNPTEYELVCNAACSSASEDLELAKITEASLEGDQMTISYSASYSASDGTSDEAAALTTSQNNAQIGRMVGTLDSDGNFEGIYEVRSEKGLDKGPIAFTFVADGTANSRAGALTIAQ